MARQATKRRVRYERTQGPKLHRSQVEVILDQLRMATFTNQHIADCWDITPGHVSHIKVRRCWGHVHA